MKKVSGFILTVILMVPFLVFSQEPETHVQPIVQSSVAKQKVTEPYEIKSGFYIKIGPSFPVGNFKLGQTLFDMVSDSSKNSGTTIKKVIYYPAKMGLAVDMGYLIYIGPAFAGNHLRAGIDASFVALSYNPTANLPDTISGSKYNFWYYYLGQKFGPVLSIRPVDRLVIDLSYKLNAYAALIQHPIGTKFKNEFGKNLTQNEISMNIRYAIILFSFQYNFGQTSYNNFNKDDPMHKIENNTYRIMIGFKF